MILISFNIKKNRKHLDTSHSLFLRCPQYLSSRWTILGLMVDEIQKQKSISQQALHQTRSCFFFLKSSGGCPLSISPAWTVRTTREFHHVSLKIGVTSQCQSASFLFGHHSQTGPSLFWDKGGPYYWVSVLQHPMPFSFTACEWVWLRLAWQSPGDNSKTS